MVGNEGTSLIHQAFLIFEPETVDIGLVLQSVSESKSLSFTCPSHSLLRSHSFLFPFMFTRHCLKEA